MYRHLTPAVDRFKALEEERQEEFRNALKGFVRLYSFLSQVMPFQDQDLEKLYTFGRFLELKLPRDERQGGLAIDDEVALAYYRLDKVSEGSILLASEKMGVYGPTELGTKTAKAKDVPLSEIIEVLNERFGTNFTPADQLFFHQVIEEAKADQVVVERAAANPFENFALALRPIVEGLFLDRMDKNQGIVTKYLNEPDFQEAAFRELANRIYEALRRAPGGSEPEDPEAGQK